MDEQHFPGVDLKKFGISPFGSPIYRCVWSDSRLHCIGGRWPDGSVEYRWVPRYSMPAWVLEKWLSAEEFAGPRAFYESSMRDDASGLVTVPYPVNGEYEHCYTFPEPVSSSMIEKVCFWIEAGRKFSMRELSAALYEMNYRQSLQWASKVRDIVQESQQAFGNRPSNVNPAKLTEDKMNISELPPLPIIGDGKPFTGGN